jgi:hypothetical protein
MTVVCERNNMPRGTGYDKLPSLVLSLLLMATPIASQEIKPLLRIERLTAELETQSNRSSSGRNIYDASSVNGPPDVQKYPNSASCLLVYDDGKYFFEKREEHTVGKPKAKSAEGVLTADDLQRLKAMLEDADLKKITTPKEPELPADTQAIREAERLDVLIDRARIFQRFTIMKERVKTGTTSAVSSSASLSGMDTYLDNGAPYKKTLSPLKKWFEDLGKRNKLQESKPQYCQAMGVS